MRAAENLGGFRRRRTFPAPSEMTANLAVGSDGDPMTRRSTGNRRINGQGGITKVTATGRYRVQCYDQHGTRRSSTHDTRA